MKQIWLVANWKSHKSIEESLKWLDEVGPIVPQSDNLKVIVCPRFSVLAELKKAVTVSNYAIQIGSQDISPFPDGAYTGEEPAQLLKELVSVSIVGHSERREKFSETDELIAQKIEMCQEVKIEPLLCVQSAEVLIPDGVNWVAYEPIFAIGSSHPDTPENANQVALEIKQTKEVNVLYGGSATSEDAVALLNQEGINGLLIGKASLDESEFIKIIKQALTIAL